MANFASFAVCRELVWFVIPLMVFGAAKLFFEEFRQGTPAATAISLFFYGGALMLAPRLARDARTEILAAKAGAVDGNSEQRGLPCAFTPE